MNNMVCVPKIVTAKLRKAFESGKIDTEDFLRATEKEKREIIEQYVGKEYSENISKRYSNKYKVELTDEQVGIISDRMKKINANREKLGTLTDEQWEAINKKRELAPDWARDYVDLADYTKEILTEENTLGMFGSAGKGLKEAGQRIANTEGIAKIGQTGKEVFNIATSPILKSLKASMDASYALRQGLRVLIKSRSNYKEALEESFKIWKAVGSKDKQDALMREFRATYLAHPRYKELVQDGKLAFGVVEEFFPTNIAEQIPVVGNVFKASNEAFTVFSQSARFGLADDMYKQQLALNKGVAPTKEQLQSIGTVVNSITGRGNLGALEKNPEIMNRLFFSARYVKSLTDIFTMPFSSKLEGVAKAEARKHSIAVLGTVAAMLAVADSFGEVEWDPRSTNFGKVKFGDTNKWVDLTNGLGQFITLGTRLATGETKSPNTGKVTKLNTGAFGDRTKTDVLFDWGSNKLAPGVGTLKQAFLDGELFGGEDVTVGNVAKSVALPITAENAYEYFRDEDKANALLLWLSELFGASIATRQGR